MSLLVNDANSARAAASLRAGAHSHQRDFIATLNERARLAEVPAWLRTTRGSIMQATMKWGFLAAVLGFSVAVGVSCGTPKCTPASCPFGCCDATGACQSGTTTSQCGGAGSDCAACGLGQGCQLNRCVPLSTGTGGGTTGGGTGGGGTTGGGTGGGATTGGGTGGGTTTGGGTGGGVTTGGGTGGGGATGGGAGGGFATQQEVTNGQLGSSCGTCNTGLTCVTAAANGYCTKNCTDSTQCLGGYCYNIIGLGAACLAPCTTDLNCRPGYSCSGTPGSLVCYPTPPATNNASLNGCYWANGDITYRYQFDGVGSFLDISWNSVSGSITSGGTYNLAGAVLTLQYSPGSGGRTETPTFSPGTPPNVYIGGTRYQRSGTVCE